jgi:hypothetical protein
MAEELCSLDAAMARDDAIVVVDQDWIGPSELLQAIRDLPDLLG